MEIDSVIFSYNICSPKKYKVRNEYIKEKKVKYEEKNKKTKQHELSLKISNILRCNVPTSININISCFVFLTPLYKKKRFIHFFFSLEPTYCAYMYVL